MTIKFLRCVGFAVGLLISTKAHGIVVENEDSTLKIESDRVAHLYGDIEQPALKRFRREMEVTSLFAGERVILINSPGGDRATGDEIISIIKAEKAQGVVVHCVVIKQAASMAFNILTNCSHRYAVNNASLMFHAIARSTPILERMTPLRLRELADELEKDEAPYRRANAKALSLSFSDYDMYSAKDHPWLAPELRTMQYLRDLVTFK